MIAPTTVARPPLSGVPPITVAAMAWSSRPIPMVGSPTWKKARPSTPATPPSRPIITIAWTRTRGIEMPEKVAASGLDPIERTR